MILLAIDPGTHCGWAIAENARVVNSGTWLLRPPRGASPGVRYLLLLARLEEVLKAYPGLTLVAVEAAHNRGGAATEYAHGIMTHVQSWCAREREDRGPIECLPIHSSKVKTVATGKGNASKEQVEAAALRRWGQSYSSDEADARWIAEAALLEVAGL